jgi:hypothetical protein
MIRARGRPGTEKGDDEEPAAEHDEEEDVEAD